MKQIFDGKLYDTDKAKYIISVERDNVANNFSIDIFKTKNGRYFGQDRTNGKLIDENSLRDCLGRFQTDLYIQLFGEVEEG